MKKCEDVNNRVLVVDDLRDIHEDIRKILCPEADAEKELDAADQDVFGESHALPGRRVFEIHSAYSGRDGVDLVRKAKEAGAPFAMAFVDVRMPGDMDGLRAVGEMWKICPNLQVVLCTAYSDYSWEEINMTVGGSDNLLILKKPFDTMEVLQLAHVLTKKWSLDVNRSAKMSAMAENIRDLESRLEKK